MKSPGEEVSRTVVNAQAPNFQAESFENDWEAGDSAHATDAIFIIFSHPVDVKVEDAVKNLFPGCNAHAVGQNQGRTTGLTVFINKKEGEFSERMKVFFEKLSPLFKLEGKINLKIFKQKLVWEKEGDRLVLKIKAEDLQG